VHLFVSACTVSGWRWHVSSTKAFPRFIFSKVCGSEIWSWEAEEHVAIKHMFLQQLLRQKLFTINKIPTRVNPADLNTTKRSVERRKLLSVLCGLYPLRAKTENEEETLMSRRVHRNVASKLAQALQFISVGLLQGCVSDDVLTGRSLRGEGDLRAYAPEQGHGWYIDYKVYVISFVLMITVVVSTRSTNPGRRLGPERGSGQHGGRAGQGTSSSSRRAPEMED